MRVARLVQRLPKVLEALAMGAIHLTGLFLLARVLTPENVDRLLAESRGKSRAEVEKGPGPRERSEGDRAAGAAAAWTRSSTAG